EAAFNPLATRDLYFVATGSGGHYFARTLAEHNRNIAKYRKTLEGNP
ncbi:MAG: aminodeoxychorismate lyase, partial [Rickettsiales bacterium]|nr:aminodeoxychorismate lyase [Rickettsiales bacterium]